MGRWLPRRRGRVAAATAAEFVGPLGSTSGAPHAMIDRIRSAAETWPGCGLSEIPWTDSPHRHSVADGVVGEIVVTELDKQSIAVASGSACTADTRMPSHVLEAMGVSIRRNREACACPCPTDAPTRQSTPSSTRRP